MYKIVGAHVLDTLRGPRQAVHWPTGAAVLTGVEEHGHWHKGSPGT